MSSQSLHTLRPSEVYTALESDPNGLALEEVEARRSLYGPNLLAEQEQANSLGRFLLHIVHPLALILWGAGALAFVLRDFVLGVVIWILVLVNAGFSFWREYRAQKAMEALSRLLPDYARVIRQGEDHMVQASEIVPGDLLVFAEGDNIPADARVVEEFGLRVNNANLTGEAVPARKTSAASFREGISELERPNLVFAGTSIVSGTGKAVVYATGMTTQFGRIARLTQATPEAPSPLQVELVRLMRIISLVAAGIGAVVFGVGLTEVGLTVPQAFLLALGIIVAIVPEGLPATITLSLAMAAQRLAQKGVLVKKLAVMETLGTVSMICTDKSGTLTQNQMTVREMWVSRRNVTVSGVGYEPVGQFHPPLTGQPFEADALALLEAASLCNNSRLLPPSIERPYWSSLGDQTEAALRVAAQKGGINEEQLAVRFPRLHELPFDARRKRMSTIHRDTPEEIAFVKGAPREVLQLCKCILIHGEEQPLDEVTRAEILAANDDYARRALRVLAFARRHLPPRSGSYTIEKVETELTFIGLMAMMDPPRPEVADAVATCRQAGIRMVMITGDYGLTAESVARRVGMLNTPTPLILTGAEIEAMQDAELHTYLDKEVVYARMAPEHKLRLVSAYQAAGEVVAVTGDGVNDAPALRKADLGVVMGLIGTDVAKEAADIILTNDNFSTIITAIEEGRAVYDNLRKFITYIFSSNVPEVMPFLLTAMFRIPLALTVRQILAIDMVTDIFPALALGIEKPEPNVMRRPPRRRNQPLIDTGLLARSFLWLGLIETVLCYTGFALVMRFYGGQGLPEFLGRYLPALNLDSRELYLLAVTVFHAGVVTSQAGNAFACRSEREKGRRLGWFSNPYLWVGVAVELAIIFLLIYVPPLAEAFEHRALPLVFWVGLFLYAPILYSLERIRKEIIWFIQRARTERQGETQDENNHYGVW